MVQSRRPYRFTIKTSTPASSTSASGSFIRALQALCFEIFFLETCQKRLNVVRSSKADSELNVDVDVDVDTRASSAKIYLRQRVFLSGLDVLHDVVSNVGPQTNISEAFSRPHQVMSFSPTRFIPTFRWVSRHAQVATTDERIRRSYRHGSIHARCLESYLHTN